MTNNRWALICAMATIGTILVAGALAFGACPEYHNVPSPWFADFWCDDDPFLEDGTVIVAVSDSGALCGVDTVAESGFLIHVIGDPDNPMLSWNYDGPDSLFPDSASFIRFRNGQIRDCDYQMAQVVAGPYMTVGWRDQSSNLLRIVWPGDFNWDFQLTIIDVMHLVGVAFHGATNYNVYDLSGDCVVNVVDIVLLADVVFGGEGYHGQMGYGCE